MKLAELFPLYELRDAIDDHQQVVDGVWRARGIECWQVAPGRF